MSPYTGHCNCKSIQVSLPQKPPNSVICHCSNCRRAGGPCSMNYLVDEDQIVLEDRSATLKIYSDGETQSGNVIARKFCSGCGSPVMTISPGFPGKAFLKASLFDGAISVPSLVVFTDGAQAWLEVHQAGEKE